MYSQSFDDGWHRRPDIAHARQALGFAPKVDLSDGLARTLAYYDGLQQADIGCRPCHSRSTTILATSR
jgi:nucleoside-diphosphate-sugar epimerase